MKHGTFIIPFLLICCLSNLLASPLQAARPLNTDDAGVVSPKSFEVEAAYEYVDQADAENNLSLVVTTGILESLDVGLEVPYQFIDLEDEVSKDLNGIADISVATKWNFLNREDVLDAALSVSYKSDNGNDEKLLGTGDREITLLMIASKQFSRTAFHVNVGPTFVKDAEDVLNFNVASEWYATESLALVGEVFGGHDFHGGLDENVLSGLVGLAYAFKEDIVGDVGVTLGISDADPDFKITGGLTIVFE
jgi:hypothetical protein